jgi:uncharacterized protein YjbI with pentapeptide repeats
MDLRRLIERLCSAVRAGRRDFANLDLRGADLSGQDLHASNFAGADLTRANLRSANLRRCNFAGLRADAWPEGFRVPEDVAVEPAT